MKLSPNQIEIIRAQIARSIQIKSLQDDVLDHVCCSLEDHEDLECEFEEAVQCVVSDLAPEGLHQLQRDTQLLLNTKYIVMKKFMYAIGLGSAIASSLGICFKLLHLQGAEPLLTYGILTFSIVYVPMQVMVWYKANISKGLLEKLRILFALLSGLATGAAIITALCRGNASVIEFMFLAGAVLFSFGFLPILFFNMYKKAVA